MIHQKLYDNLNRLFRRIDKYISVSSNHSMHSIDGKWIEERQNKNVFDTMSWPRYSGNIIQPCYWNLQCLQISSFKLQVFQCLMVNHINVAHCVHCTHYKPYTQANNLTWHINWWLVMWYVYTWFACYCFKCHLLKLLVKSCFFPF